MEYIPAKTIVTKNKDTGWFGADYSMNIYRGCPHGCIYCDSRSNCYKIENFDKVRAKENALSVIRDDLRRKVKKGVIMTGAMSDPYNFFEAGLKLTRHALELISAFGFGAAIATKASLVTRDIDILDEIKKHSPVLIKLTITTFDDGLCKKIEPNVSLTSERFLAVEELSKNNIYTGILMMPVLPYINDNEENILNIVRRAKESGARFIYPAMGVTLRDGQREYFYEKINGSFDGLAQKYIKQYGNRYTAASKNAAKLYYAFKNECEKLGVLYNMRDIIKSYKLGYSDTQLKFF
ncbi:MAG: radical SAM protein [Clostridiales bacterium]|jgi:DNA repair photolyase|nr:radical SAM protein [Clostridiales bacterium]